MPQVLSIGRVTGSTSAFVRLSGCEQWSEHRSLGKPGRTRLGNKTLLQPRHLPLQNTVASFVLMAQLRGCKAQSVDNLSKVLQCLRFSGVEGESG